MDLGTRVWHPRRFCRGEWHHHHLTKGEWACKAANNLSFQNRHVSSCRSRHFSRTNQKKLSDIIWLLSTEEIFSCKINFLIRSSSRITGRIYLEMGKFQPNIVWWTTAICSFSLGSQSVELLLARNCNRCFTHVCLQLGSVVFLLLIEV